MQTQKRAVKQAIEAAALQEFLEKGFMAASMRSIAAQAKVSTGNIYKYYVNKEALFEELVLPMDKEMKQLFAAPAEGLTLPAALQILGEQLPKLLSTYREAFLILYDRSEGSPYAPVKSSWMKVVANLFTYFFGVYNTKHPEKPFDPRIATAASASFMEGIVQLVREYREAETIHSLTLEYIRHYFYWSLPS
ncbi:TetR family transcriptional regulator [Paenibacillus turpanensis]|uniref:TetR family transcriptional regulator n=1 Tax=Paenibacillus turpanensis TaxID=2689078 RepID=UPI0014094BDF